MVGVWGLMLVVNLVGLLGVCCGEPEVEVVLSEGVARPGLPYEVSLEVSWRGDADAFAILPAEFEAVEWGTVALSRTRSFVRDGDMVVAQTLTIVANEAGDFELPAIKIGYLSPEAVVQAETSASDEADSTNPSVTPALRVPPFTLEVRDSSLLLWMSLGFGALLFLLLLVWLIFRRSCRMPGDQPEISTMSAQVAQVQEVLHEARKHRLDGKYYDFYLSLGRGAELVRDMGGDASLASRFRKTGEDVGYRSLRPLDDDMDMDYRELERVLTLCRRES